MMLGNSEASVTGMLAKPGKHNRYTVRLANEMANFSSLLGYSL